MRPDTRALFALLFAVLLPAIGLSAQKTESAQALLRAAMDTATVEGDLKGAISQYQTIVETFKVDRGVVATALVRIADCYRKLGDAQARQVYERIVRDFADQPAAVEEARTHLATLPAAARTSQTVRLVWSGASGAVRGSISPDGRYLTFYEQVTRGLGIRDLKDNTSRVLAHAPTGSMYYAVFSPDGRRVAYTWATQSGNENEFDLRVLSVSGDATAPRVVYRNEEMLWPRPFGWTPDSKQLLILRSLRDGTNQITLIGIEDGSARVLKSIPWNYAAMSLSPDGRYVAYEAIVGDRTAPSEIFVIAADGSRETKVVEGSGINSSPLWSPDGSQLLFLTDRTGTMSLWSLPMADGRPTGQPVLAKADIGRVRLQGITRSGTLHYLSAGVLRANVYTAELDATGRTAKPPAIVSERFINSNSAPTWSPDGQQLAYLSSRAQRGTVLVIRTEKTGEERDIALPRDLQTGNLLPAPRWFPDGRSLLVFGILAGGRGLYHRVDVASGKVETLHEAKGVSGNSGLGASVVSHDGTAILYIASPTTPYQGQSNLIRFEIDAKRETVLKSGPFNAVALSPDGAQVALHTYDGTPGGCHLQVMPSSGGELRGIVRTGNCNPNRMAWSPTNDLVFVTGGNTTPNVVWRIRADGGEPQQLGISMPGQLMYPDLHPDGRRIALAVFDTGASEVWALENFLPKASK